MFIPKNITNSKGDDEIFCPKVSNYDNEGILNFVTHLVTSKEFAIAPNRSARKITWLLSYESPQYLHMRRLSWDDAMCKLNSDVFGKTVLQIMHVKSRNSFSGSKVAAVVFETSFCKFPDRISLLNMKLELS